MGTMEITGFLMDTVICVLYSGWGVVLIIGPEPSSSVGLLLLFFLVVDKKYENRKLVEVKVNGILNSISKQILRLVTMMSCCNERVFPC